MLLIRTAESRDARALGELGAALMRAHYAFDPQRFLAAGSHAERGYASFLQSQLDDPDVVVLRKRLTITGSTLRPRSAAFKAGVARSLRGKVWPLIEAGRIKPVIYRELIAAQAAEAHALMESNQHIGKIVLNW